MKQITIIGGGDSIREGIAQNLIYKLKDTCTIGINNSYRYFDTTCLCFVDFETFYLPNKENLKQLPLIIGRHQKQYKKSVLPNTILLSEGYPFSVSLNNGVYIASLTGIMALSIATHLLNGVGDIFLLGFDFGAYAMDATNKKPRTHFYQDDLQAYHSGIGYVSFYEQYKHKTEKLFSPFINLPDLHIFNVSAQSNIHCFEKISYLEFYAKKIEKISQDFTRKIIREKLSKISI